jgi:hypothetical protein
MKWFIYERLMVSNLLPPKGSISILELSEGIREKLKISAEEVKLTNAGYISDPKTGIKNFNWNKQFDKGKEIEFSEIEIDLISASLKKADTEGNLPNHPLFLAFYKSFFEVYKHKKELVN